MPSPEPAKHRKNIKCPHRNQQTRLREHWSDLTGKLAIKHPSEPRPRLTTSPGLTSTTAPPDLTSTLQARSDLASQRASTPGKLHRLHEHQPAKLPTIAASSIIFTSTDQPSCQPRLGPKPFFFSSIEGILVTLQPQNDIVCPFPSILMVLPNGGGQIVRN